MTIITAKAKFVRCSPRKMRLIADLICHRNVTAARRQLEWLRKSSVTPLRELLRSAVANAKDQYDVSEEKLIVDRVVVDGGPTLKRFRARAFGRAAPIRHRTSHITMTLKADETLKKRTPQDRVRTTPVQEPIAPVVSGTGEEKPPETHVDTKEHGRATGGKEHTDRKPRSKGFFKQLFQRRSGM